MAAKAIEGPQASFFSLPTRETVHQVSLYIAIIAALGTAIATAAYLKGYIKFTALPVSAGATAIAATAVLAATSGKVGKATSSYEWGNPTTPEQYLIHELRNKLFSESKDNNLRSLMTPKVFENFEAIIDRACKEFPQGDTSIDHAAVTKWVESLLGDTGELHTLFSELFQRKMLLFEVQNELELLLFQSQFISCLQERSESQLSLDNVKCPLQFIRQILGGEVVVRRPQPKLDDTFFKVGKDCIMIAFRGWGILQSQGIKGVQFSHQSIQREIKDLTSSFSECLNFSPGETPVQTAQVFGELLETRSLYRAAIGLTFEE